MSAQSILAAALALSSLAVPFASVQAAESEENTLVRRAFGSLGDKQWSDLLVDTAAGSISAAGMLGVAGDSITTVENVRDIVVAAKGLTADDDKSFGISITPARTSLTPMNLYTYSQSLPMRLLGSLTFGYAQADASIDGGGDYERRAFSIDTNAYFFREDDPVLAYADAVASAAAGDDCEILRRAMPVGGLPGAPTPPAAPPATGAPAPAAPPVAPAATPTPPAVATEGPVKPKEVEGAEVKARAKACAERIVKSRRWNRSQISLAYATGRIKPSDGGGRGEEKLGHAMALGLTYGFDYVGGLADKLALAITYRRSFDEPVLATLLEPVTVRKDSSLTVARLTGGSETLRVLAEVSDARSSSITASQRAFKQALGLDIRIFDKTWLNLRVGRQRTLDGTDEETGSLLSLSYSPTVLLKP